MIVLFTTYNRPAYAKRALEAAIENLSCEDDVIDFYLADAGSDPNPIDWMAKIVESAFINRVVGSHSEQLTPGANWNKGIAAIYEQDPIYLRLEDDFVLEKKMELSPYRRLLENSDSVGMVRLGLLPENLDLHSYGYKGQIYLDVQKTQQYCFSGHPSLVHKRFHEAYGLFNEQTNPGDTEVDFDGRVRSTDGPRIWWPVDLGTWSVWAHIGAEKSY